jgi:hypothetical protein
MRCFNVEMTNISKLEQKIYKNVSESPPTIIGLIHDVYILANSHEIAMQNQLFKIGLMDRQSCIV